MLDTYQVAGLRASTCKDEDGLGAGASCATLELGLGAREQLAGLDVAVVGIEVDPDG